MVLQGAPSSDASIVESNRQHRGKGRSAMTALDAVPATYADAVEHLACWHGEGQQIPIAIYAFDDPRGKTIRLVEVSDSFFPTGEVYPLVFGRSGDFPFRSAVALLTPEEWALVQRGRLPLPDGWDLRTAKRVWPRDDQA